MGERKRATCAEAYTRFLKGPQKLVLSYSPWVKEHLAPGAAILASRRGYVHGEKSLSSSEAGEPKEYEME